MIPRRHLSTSARLKFYEANIAKGDEHPRCNIPGCGLFVIPGQRWVESHYPKPHAWQGQKTGVAHARCNHDYWRTVEAPMMAKVKRAKAKHVGAYVPERPMLGSIASGIKKPMNGPPIDRWTGQPWGTR